MRSAIPVIEGWFTVDDPPSLLGGCCPDCGTYRFPPTGVWCPNPACDGEHMETVPLSRTGLVWSYTDAQYQPPAPYVAPSDPYRPFAIAAVELEREKIVILGQVAEGFGVGDLHVGSPVELVVEPLGSDRDVTKLVWRWRPLTDEDGGPA
jgi:uncharacterized OB-fold protein